MRGRLLGLQVSPGDWILGRISWGFGARALFSGVSRALGLADFAWLEASGTQLCSLRISVQEVMHSPSSSEQVVMHSK